MFIKSIVIFVQARLALAQWTYNHLDIVIYGERYCCCIRSAVN
jgi:hypothetical protein